MARDTQHEAAIEAAAEASWRSGVSEDADWELLTPGQQAMVREEWAAGKAAYDAARSGGRDPNPTFTHDQIEAVVARMREGHWPDEWITQLQAVLRAARSGEAEGEQPSPGEHRFVLVSEEDPDETESCIDCGKQRVKGKEIVERAWQTGGFAKADCVIEADRARWAWAAHEARELIRAAAPFVNALAVMADDPGPSLNWISEAAQLVKSQPIAALSHHPEPRQDQPVDRASGETPQDQWARESNEHQIAHEAAEHPVTGERPERKMSVYEDGERGGVLQPETGDREACCSDPDLHPSTGGNRQCLGCGKTTAPREADLPDAHKAATEYEETKRRVIAGKASVYEAQEFIDFIEGAITNPPQPLQDGADQHGPNHPAHKHPRQLGDGPMCDCFREGWDSCDSLANARRAKSAQYLRENPDPPLQDGGEGSCCDCGKPLTVDDTPSICADCSQRLDEAFIDDAVPWLGLDRHEEARRQFRGGWLARAALPPEHPHQDVEPARHEIRTILSRFTLSDDEWLCIDNLLSRLGHQDVGRLSPDADAPRPKPDRDPSSLLFVPEAVRRMRVFVARIEEDEREQAKRQADKERVQT